MDNGLEEIVQFFALVLCTKKVLNAFKRRKKPMQFILGNRNNFIHDILLLSRLNVSFIPCKALIVTPGYCVWSKDWGSDFNNDLFNWVSVGIYKEWSNNWLKVNITWKICRSFLCFKWVKWICAFLMFIDRRTRLLIILQVIVYILLAQIFSLHVQIFVCFLLLGICLYLVFIISISVLL